MKDVECDMIYDSNSITRLPALGPSSRPPKSPMRKIAEWFVFGFLFLLSLFILMLVILPIVIIGVLLFLPYKLVKFFTAGKKAKGVSEPIDDEVENAPIVINAYYDDRTEVLSVNMSNKPFQEFLQFLKNHLVSPNGQYQRSLRKRYTPDDVGYHLHFCLGTEEVIFGIGDGLFELDGGDKIWAAKEVWQKAITAWEDVLEQQAERYIVLDKYQDQWCKDDSIGRFQIHYIPDAKEHNS